MKNTTNYKIWKEEREMALTVRMWRCAKEISQEKMANLLGIHVNTYQNWEKNPENISIGNARKIAEIFGVSENEIDFTTKR